MKNLIYILLIFFISCDDSSPSENSPSSADSMIESNSLSDIHGTSIGDDINYVMDKIRPHIVSEMPDEVTARIPLNIKDSTFYDIDYDFRDGMLYSIDLDIFPKDLKDCKILFTEFQNYYDKSYGKGSQDEGYVVWYTKTKDGDDLEISMIDESSAHKKPYLAITFYQEDGIAD